MGKTTLGKSLLASPSGYLNWDVPDHREHILSRELPPPSPLLFDEIHKYRGWRNYLKGLYDAGDNRRHVLVTGSARLDFYRFGGVSLQGRYHYFRLHPFSVGELAIRSEKDFHQLLTLGGFPEPFLSGSQTEAKRWARENRDRLIREDIVGLETVQDLSLIHI